ncbi:uncharacterized protein LOC109420368 isoform X2 [Aedes albopictus]|uniref:Uncharacterized protein n=1 Tax=Aedes albopictus TaxID=7160 RepID=A0ABM1XWY0_AEDAL
MISIRLAEASDTALVQVRRQLQPCHLCIQQPQHTTRGRSSFGPRTSPISDSCDFPYLVTRSASCVSYLPGNMISIRLAEASDTALVQVRRKLQPCHLCIQQPQHTTRGRSRFGPRTSPISDSCDFPYLVTRSASSLSYLPVRRKLQPCHLCIQQSQHTTRGRSSFGPRTSPISDSCDFPYLVTRSASSVSYLPGNMISIRLAEASDTALVQVRRKLQPCHLCIQQPQHTSRGRSSFGPRTSPISDSCDFPYLVTRSASCVSYLPGNMISIRLAEASDTALVQVRRKLQPCHLCIQQPQHTTRGRSRFGPRTSPISDSCDFPYLVTRSASSLSYLPVRRKLQPCHLCIQQSQHTTRGRSSFGPRTSPISDSCDFPYLVTRSASSVSYLPGNMISIRLAEASDTALVQVRRKLQPCHLCIQQPQHTSRGRSSFGPRTSPISDSCDFPYLVTRSASSLSYLPVLPPLHPTTATLDSRPFKF